MKSAQTRSWIRHTFGLILVVTVAGLYVAMGLALDIRYQRQVEAAETRPRHLGYGIHVGPHLPPRPEMVSELGMDWVKVYTIEQARDYPNQRVMYRIEMRSIPGTAWENGLVELTQVMVNAGIDAVEIGNEPNLTGEWDNGFPDPEGYADGLCRGYRVIKSVAPGMVVVTGGLAPTAGTGDGRNIDDFVFARRMLDAGAGACFDAWGYHPYGFNQPPEADPRAQPFSFRRAELMREILVGYGLRDKQMWMTEWGWVRNPGEAGMDCSASPVFNNFQWMAFSSEVQAGYTARAWRFAERNWPWAGPMFLWNLDWNTYIDGGYEDPCSHLRWYGLLDQDGNPLPVYYATQQVIKRTPVEYRPTVGAVIDSMTQIVEAGCAGYMELGRFTVYNTGYPGALEAEVLPANAPGRPFVSTDVETARSRDTVTVFVDATGVEPGLHLVAVNLRDVGNRSISSYTVRGWLFVTYPSSPECIARYNG